MLMHLFDVCEFNLQAQVTSQQQVAIASDHAKLREGPLDALLMFAPELVQ